MSSDAARILNDALTLPDLQRRQIVEALLDSIAPERSEEIESAWVEEARRRAERLELGQSRARDGEMVLREIAAKLHG
jgi:hypothetical protein